MLVIVGGQDGIKIKKDEYMLSVKKVKKVTQANWNADLLHLIRICRFSQLFVSKD